MKVGVKVGPRDWKESLEKTEAQFCEIFFRLDRKEEYEQLFRHLAESNINKFVSYEIKFGLHFWGIIEGKYEPNLLFEPQGIADQSQRLLEESIDLAGRVGASYLNVHPGGRKLLRSDLDKKQLRPVEGVEGKEVSKEEGMHSLKKRCLELDSYAREKGVLLLVETLPAVEGEHWRDLSGRKNPWETKNVDISMIEELGKEGIGITNDFAHSALSFLLSDRKAMFEKTLEASRRLKPYTKLLHATAFPQPFNGIDWHSGFTDEEERQGVFPNKEELRQLLRIFKDTDLWLIPEPEERMAENYFILKDLVESL